MADQEKGQQSNIIQEYTNARAGLDLDSSVNQIQKGKLTYALNSAVENFDGNSVSYQNEPGNEACLTFPANYHVIGEHFIPEQNKHIFFLTNPETGGCQIGWIENNDCEYVEFISGDCLNFNIDYPILKTVHKITNCTTEIYWTDGINPRRYLDLDPNNKPWTTIFVDDSVCQPETILTLDCNKLKVQPNFNIPSLDVVDIVNGGDLKAGIYQFAIQYSNASGDGYTSYYSVTNPTPIANPELTTANFDYPVGKSIVLNIGNLDISGYFQYYNVAVIKTINNITSVQLIGTHYIDGSLKELTYTGQNVAAIPLTQADIFEKFPFYEIAQDLTAVRDILVWDNLTSIDRVNYQSIASKINLLWQTYKIPATEDYSDPLNATNLRGYLRDEVYAFEIVFLLKNGKQTDGFHIPGRVQNFNELSQPDVPTTNNDFIGEPTTIDPITGIGYSPYWKIYNTASVIGDSPGGEGYNIGNATPYQYGEFAYWESDLKYPCNTEIWGDLADTPIRHHKFPDVLVSPIFESPTPFIIADKYAVEMIPSQSVFPLGVKIDTQQVAQLISSSNLTQDQKDDIIAFKIVRGNRSTNRSIVAKGILRNVGKYNKEGTSYYYPNYPYNDLNSDPFLLEKSNAYNSQCDTFKASVSTAGVIQYTDCYTGEVGTKTIEVGETNICSITLPTVTSGAATFQNITLTAYTITYGGGFFPGFTTVQYTDPITTFPAFTTVYDSIIGTVTKTVNSTSVPVIINGSDKTTIIGNNAGINTICYPAKLDGFNTLSSKYRMVFNSPDTSFGQPTLGNVLKIENVMFGAGRAHFVQVKKHAMYRLLSKSAQVDALNSSYAIANGTGTLDVTAMFTCYQAYLQIYINGITRKNYTYSFNSVAGYDYSAPVENNSTDRSGNRGFKQRTLDKCQYLIPGVQSIGESFNINNWNRESSVYLKTIDARDLTPVVPLLFPSDTQSLQTSGGSLISDESRFTLSETGNCATPDYQQKIKVVSYYGSIKNVVPAQWGEMYSYQTIDTGFQRNLLNIATVVNDPETIFGGDTFIGKFAFKTKLPFFIDNRVGAPDDSDIFYDQLGNIAYPQYWYSGRSIVSDYLAGTKNLKNIISVKANYLDCPNGEPVSTSNTSTTTTTTSTTTPPGTVTTGSMNTYYDGKMYLFAYGIPYYFVESSINVDLRQAFNNLEGDFYPHVSSGIPDTWLQESVVPITFDNTYTYNVTYSRQNIENYFSHLPVNWDDNQCYTNFPFRAIYSDPQQSYVDNRINSWLIYRPISFFDFPQNYGDLVSLDGIQNKAVLARFENKSLLYNTLLTIDTSNPQAAYIGNSRLFSSAPAVDFAETDLGYAGSQNKFLLKIPQGQITIDAKRGQVFLISGNAAVDITSFGSGVNRFFTDHLAFEILRYFPTVNTDNHFNGCGLHGVYDSKFERIIITKLDYIPINPNIKYDEATQDFYIDRDYTQVPPPPLTVRKIVKLTDREYFCNKSFTMSFNFNTKSWISYHTYLPNFYLGDNNFFYSGLNEGCDLEAIAVTIIPSTTTTTTTTVILNCNLNGRAVYVPDPCGLDGTAVCDDCTTTTTTTSTTTTAYIPGPIWYRIQNCLDGDYAYSQQSESGDFSIGQIVISAGNWWSVISVVTVNPAVPLVTITASVLTTCPTIRYIYTVNRYICDTEYPNDCAASYIDTFQIADDRSDLNVGEPGNYWFYLDEINSYLLEVISYDGAGFGEGLLLTNMIGGSKNCNSHCPLPIS